VDREAIMYAAPHPVQRWCPGDGAGTPGPTSGGFRPCDAKQCTGEGPARTYSTISPSVFPTAVSVDPSETILAFSYLAAAKLLASWG